jgi:hypothetical protein
LRRGLGCGLGGLLGLDCRCGKQGSGNKKHERVSHAPMIGFTGNGPKVNRR